VTGTGEKAAFPDFLALLSSPHLTGLTALDASGYEYGDGGLFELLGASGRRPGGGRGRRRGWPSRAGAGLLPSLRRLRRLSLHNAHLTDDGLRLLLESPLADTLTHLDVSAGHDGPRLTAAGVRALVESRLWPRLEALNISGLYANNDPQAARLLFEALPHSGLRALGLQSYAWAPEVTGAALVGAMAAARSWGRLEALAVSGNLFRREDLRALCRCPQLAGLRRLEIGGELSGAGVAALAGCPFLAGLTVLRLAGSRLNDRGMAALAASPHLRRLVYLDVDMCPVGDAGVAAFVESPNAERLRLLDVPGVGDHALQVLARSPYLGRLTVVRFGAWVGPAKFAPATDAGALAIARSDTLPNLVVLNRHWSKEASAGLRALLECDRLVYAGWAMYEGDGSLHAAAMRRAAALPHAFTSGQTLLPLFPWSQGARL
jgi:hypothetical protein